MIVNRTNGLRKISNYDESKVSLERIPKSKILADIDVFPGDVIKCKFSEGVMTARFKDYTMYKETYASADEIYVVIDDDLLSIVFPEGCSVYRCIASGNGSICSWNDLKDKPFGITDEFVEIIPETTYTLESSEGVGIVFMNEPVSFVPGNTYRVIWNGDEYNCVCDDLNGRIYIGDAGPVTTGISNTGEPFCVVTYNTETRIEVFDGSTEVVISISEKVEVTRKLDSKFLPKYIETLYVGNTDRYVYLDSALTTKITREELRSLVTNSIIRVCDISDSPYWVMHMNVLVTPTDIYDEVTVFCDVSGNVSLNNYHTSEYVETAS